MKYSYKRTENGRGGKKISEISKKFRGKNVKRTGASESGDGSAGGGGSGTAALLSVLAG